MDGHCSCYDQYYCQDCSLSVIDLFAGEQCPIVPTFSPTPVPTPLPTPSPSASPTVSPTPGPTPPPPTWPPTVPITPSPGSCSTNVDCYERGQCINGKCQCNTGYTCPDCSLTHAEFREIGTCPPPLEIPVGGAHCLDNAGGKNNFYCYNQGICSSPGICTCLSGWVCGDCQHKLQAILSGANPKP
jgi:hypothetical protein